MEAQTSTPHTECECGVHPSVFYLLATLLLTSCSTAMLCASIMTDHWEQVKWDHTALAALANASNTALQWLLDDKVAKIEDTSHKKAQATFLVPMNGGIWTMCVSLEDEEVTILYRAGFPKQPLCTNYLADNDDEEPRADWQHRMQNLSISCALVCLIVLGSAALVGTFGVCKHQISAVLITGVMYLLAGLFAMFTLMIIHFKRIQRVSTRGSMHGDDTSDGVVGPQNPAYYLLSAREFSTSWSLDLGWGGVALAATTSLLWILLSKIMRYNPISTLLL
ncbi:uncharacterized protein LOC128673916 [Plodia interpunctella]|uniref:uncharacterized protein LOC128673916 n=1 Tax=Plodia interpunctella TaxID=58824 RepID=UPI00236871A7|nr:uncharacterized protein LOC128673916 [Plodia interpunctella]XP_053608060.1 uncharacterized protein LOC128673916 [Plodia interpunctella]XP_053608061.1 uncharacterized protein LOC128673916 [Plodia interpunctella]